MSNPTPIKRLLADQLSDPWLRAIQRANNIHHLSRWVQCALDPELGKHCQVLNLRQNRLIIAVDGTVWATRLRYQIPELLTILKQQQGLKQLSDIQIRVKPTETPPAKKPLRHITLSDDSAYCIQRCAEIVDDEGLRSALQRLAGRRRS